MNKKNGKLYVGSAAVSFDSRWRQHLRRLRQRKHCNPHLQGSFDLHGEQAFEFKVLEYCEPAECIKIEQVWLDSFLGHADIYNICLVAGSSRGRKHKPEVIERLSKGRFGSGNPNWGREHSEETKELMRTAALKREARKREANGK